MLIENIFYFCLHSINLSSTFNLCKCLRVLFFDPISNVQESVVLSIFMLSFVYMKLSLCNISNPIECISRSVGLYLQ